MCVCYGKMEAVPSRVNLYFEGLHISFHIFEIFCVL